MNAYFSDLLSCHDSRIQAQANSIRDHLDGEAQLSVLADTRALIPYFTSPEHRYGSFVFTLTDLHPNNIFVDANWHIKCLIDLEWSCVRPLEMTLLPPVWFAGRKVDELTKGGYLDAYTYTWRILQRVCKGDGEILLCRWFAPYSYLETELGDWQVLVFSCFRKPQGLM